MIVSIVRIQYEAVSDTISLESGIREGTAMQPSSSPIQSPTVTKRSAVPTTKSKSPSASPSSEITSQPSSQPTFEPSLEPSAIDTTAPTMANSLEYPPTDTPKNKPVSRHVLSSAVQAMSKSIIVIVGLSIAGLLVAIASLVIFSRRSYVNQLKAPSKMHGNHVSYMKSKHRKPSKLRTAIYPSFSRGGDHSTPSDFTSYKGSGSQDDEKYRKPAPVLRLPKDIDTENNGILDADEQMIHSGAYSPTSAYNGDIESSPTFSGSCLDHGSSSPSTMSASAWYKRQNSNKLMFLDGSFWNRDSRTQTDES